MAMWVSFGLSVFLPAPKNIPICWLHPKLPLGVCVCTHGAPIWTYCPNQGVFLPCTQYSPDSLQPWPEWKRRWMKEYFTFVCYCFALHTRDAGRCREVCCMFVLWSWHKWCNGRWVQHPIFFFFFFLVIVGGMLLENRCQDWLAHATSRICCPSVFPEQAQDCKSCFSRQFMNGEKYRYCCVVFSGLDDAYCPSDTVEH